MIQIKSNDDIIATADKVVTYVLKDFSPDMPDIRCYYFKKIKLSPIIAFEHLAGTALRRWLDGCYVVSEDEEFGPLRYVHGRSEVMRGKHTISAVLLANPLSDLSIDAGRWLSCVPDVWKSFLSTGLDQEGA